jgi:hypothetical protein
MDDPILVFIRDRFESLEDSQTGIHRKLDDIDTRLTHLENPTPKPSRVGAIAAGGAGVVAMLYEFGRYLVGK